MESFAITINALDQRDPAGTRLAEGDITASDLDTAVASAVETAGHYGHVAFVDVDVDGDMVFILVDIPPHN